MTDSKALAELRPNATMPSRDEWGTIMGMAEQLITTGFLPSTIQKPAQAAAIMLKGRELGIPPMYALSNINVIKGKPVANAELMMALVKRAYGPDSIWFEDTDNKQATVGYKIPGDKARYYSFTITDATNAQLGGDNWKKYPAAMLRARAVSAVCRMAFPEVIAGMYTPGELGERVIVNDDEEVLSAGEVYGEPDKWGPGAGGGPPRYTPTATVERIDQNTGEISAAQTEVTLVDREYAAAELARALEDNGYTEDDLAVYFDRAGIDPETVEVKRLMSIALGLKQNPVAFGETVEKHRLQMQAAQDPELMNVDF